MDSKLRRMTILASMAVILLAAMLVLYVNRERGERPAPSDPEPSQSVELQEEPDSGQIGNDLKAFLRDNTFFDPEMNPILEAARDDMTRLSLVVTSVEKDLRVRVVDMSGEPVTGESFFISLDGVGEYKDLDKDGVIYIGGLTAGEYYVELLPIAGYHVPENETRVRVKDKVEYLAIDDISLLIRTEADIDAEAEDTAVADALEDADKTEIKKFQKTTGNSRLGIDVSKWNGEIDWDRVRSAGVEYAIIRAGYRGSVTGSLVEDPYFAVNMKGAAASGLPVGVYFFTQAVNEVEAVEEASAVLDLVKESFTESSYAKYRTKAIRIFEQERDQYLRKAIFAQYARFSDNFEYSGNVRLSLDKVVDVIRYFSNAPQVIKLYKVKLMKLLWYSDTLSFKRRGHAITGLIYQALPMGAVPIAHDSIIDLYGVDYDEVELGDGTGYYFKKSVNEQYQSLSKEDMDILDEIIRVFGSCTKDTIIHAMHMETAYVKTASRAVISFQYAKELSIP